MEPLDLEKYKNAWKKEAHFQEEKLSEKDISQFLRSSSKNIQTHFRSALILDIVLKSLLVLAACFLFFFHLETGSSLLIFSLIGILVGGIFIQLYLLKKLTNQDLLSKGIVDTLKSTIEFYHKEYFKSIPIGASTSTMVFLIGSIFYLQNKYAEIPSFEWDDYLVFGIGILLSFSISFFSQQYFNQFKINQLQEVLNDAGEIEVDELYIQKYRSNRRKLVLIFGILLMVGLALFLMLFFK